MDSSTGEQEVATTTPESKSEKMDSNEYVEKKLNARVEIDDAGFNRKIYSLNGVTFAFRGREELPIFPTLIQSKSSLLGDIPHQISKEEYAIYKTKVDETQHQENAPQYYLATKTLLGVVELARKLGNQDPSLTQIQEELTQGIYSPQALDLLDALIATNYIKDADSNSEENTSSVFEDYHNNNGEALVLLMLLGDKQAQEMVKKKVELLKRFESSKDQSTQEYGRKLEAQGVEPLDPKKIICVHATKHTLQKNESGDFIIPSGFDATEGKIVMNTVHTYLNSKVTVNNGGSWESDNYVLLSPFESMVKTNGLPTTLQPADTFWARDPGEPVIFADASLVEPGGNEITGLYKIEGNTTKFKSEGLSREDLVSLVNYMKEHGQNLDIFLTMSFDPTIYSEFPPEPTNGWEYQNFTKAIHAIAEYIESSSKEPKSSFFAKLIDPQQEGQQSLEKIISDIVEKSQAVDKSGSVTKDKIDLSASLTVILANRVKSIIFAEINRIAVEETIRTRGFEVKRGDGYGWSEFGDSQQTPDPDQKRLMVLASKLGVAGVLHQGTNQKQLTEIFHGNNGGNGDISEAYQTDENGIRKFQWSEYYDSNVDSLVSQLDSKSRRVLYASGYLTSRIIS